MKLIASFTAFLKNLAALNDHHDDLKHLTLPEPGVNARVGRR